MFGVWVGKLAGIETGDKECTGTIMVPNGKEREYLFVAQGGAAEVLAEKEIGKTVVISGYLRFPSKDDQGNKPPYIEVVDARTAVQRVVAVGRLVADPELRYTPNGNGVCKGRVAVQYGKNETDFVNVEVWNNEAYNAAEIFAEYGKKGQLIYIEGVLKPLEYSEEGDMYPPAITVLKFRWLGGGGRGKSRDLDADELDIEAPTPKNTNNTAKQDKQDKNTPSWKALRRGRR